MVPSPWRALPPSVNQKFLFCSEDSLEILGRRDQGSWAEETLDFSQKANTYPSQYSLPVWQSSFCVCLSNCLSAPEAWDFYQVNLKQEYYQEQKRSTANICWIIIWEATGIPKRGGLMLSEVVIKVEWDILCRINKIGKVWPVQGQVIHPTGLEGWRD